MNISSKIIVAALMAAAGQWLVAPAAAAPISSPLALQNAVAPLVETVQYRRGWPGGYRGGRFGGAGLGLAAGAIIGGAIIAATRPYGYDGYDPGYTYAPGYAYSGYAYAPGYEYAPSTSMPPATRPAMPPTPVAATSAIASSASGRTTRPQVPISDSTAYAIRVRDLGALSLGPTAPTAARL